MGKKFSEIESLAAIDGALNRLDDPQARDRVLRWAWEKYSGEPVPRTPTETSTAETTTPPDQAPQKKAPRSKAASKKGAAKSTATIDKNLNLRPRGKKSLDDFVGEKMPKTNWEKCVVSVFYMKNEIAVEQVGLAQVYTCYKHMSWRVPKDLANTLRSTASHKGWLDTKKQDDIKLTVMGENCVEHDLPPKTDAK